MSQRGASQRHPTPSLTEPILGTFSIAARCSRTGMLGAAVSTAIPAAGAYVTVVRAGVGAACTQAWANFGIAHDALHLLEQGLDVTSTAQTLIERDLEPQIRQFGIVDIHGNSASHTGDECVPWAGHLTGSNYSVQGNMLVGAATVEAMAEAFEQNARQDLPERLVRVLEAAQQAGGDKRGRQSAAIYVVRDDEWPYVSLRVDEHIDPVSELRRVLEVAKHQLIPFIDQLPTRANPGAKPDPNVVEMNLKPPEDRTA